MTKINRKENLNKNDIHIVPNTGGGNCYYKTLSQIYNNTEEYHIYYRKIIAIFVESKRSLDEQNYQTFHFNSNDFIYINDKHS